MKQVDRNSRVCLTQLGRMWLGRILPFFIIAILLLGLSCNKNAPDTDILVDGGLVIENNYEVHWAAEDFPIDVIIDAYLPDQTVGDIYEAIEFWNTAVGEIIFYPIVMDFNEELPEYDCGWVVIVDKDELDYSGIWRGVYGDTRGTLCFGQITLNSDEHYSVQMNMLVAHELGHSLGLAHDKVNKKSIMYPIILTEPQYVMPEDAVRIRKMFHGDFAVLDLKYKETVLRSIRGLANK